MHVGVAMFCTGYAMPPTEWPAYRDAGIERIVISIASEPADTVLPLLDTLAGKLAQVEA